MTRQHGQCSHFTHANSLNKVVNTHVRLQRELDKGRAFGSPPNSHQLDDTVSCTEHMIRNSMLLIRK